MDHEDLIRRHLIVSNQCAEPDRQLLKYCTLRWETRCCTSSLILLIYDMVGFSSQLDTSSLNGLVEVCTVNIVEGHFICQYNSLNSNLSDR